MWQAVRREHRHRSHSQTDSVSDLWFVLIHVWRLRWSHNIQLIGVKIASSKDARGSALTATNTGRKNNKNRPMKKAKRSALGLWNCRVIATNTSSLLEQTVMIVFLKKGINGTEPGSKQEIKAGFQETTRFSECPAPRALNQLNS